MRLTLRGWIVLGVLVALPVFLVGACLLRPSPLKGVVIESGDRVLVTDVVVDAQRNLQIIKVWGTVESVQEVRAPNCPRRTAYMVRRDSGTTVPVFRVDLIQVEKSRYNLVPHSPDPTATADAAGE